MPTAPFSPDPARPPARLREHLRNYFFAGVLVTGPAALTIYVAWLFVDFIDRGVASLVPAPYNEIAYLPLHIPGLGLIVVVIGLTLIGALTANYLGRRLLRLGDRILARMPLIRGLYGAMKQIFETVLSKKSNTFREVVLLEWPRRGVWTIGFITGKAEGEIRDLTDEEAINVYVPTTPNPTSGYLMHLPRRDVVVLSMTVEEGIKFVISGGIVAPPARRTVPQAEPAEPSL